MPSTTIRLAALGALALLSTAPAQNTIVSPTTAATMEGSTNNVFPWASAIVRRYQQIHGDLGTTPKLITQLDWRVNAPTAATTFTGTSAIAVEMYMGLGRPVTQTGPVYALNYVGPRTLVFARKTVNMGPQGMATPPGPNPFTANMRVVLDRPYPYTGAMPLLWEAVVTDVAITGTFTALDADSGSVTTAGAAIVTGPGCVATLRAGNVTLLPSAADMSGTLLVNFTLTRGPANSPVLLGLGASNPNLPVPGLCSNVHTDLLMFLLIGNTDAGGALTADQSASSTFILPNSLGGATIYCQAHLPDPGRPDPIKVSNSNGLSFVVPTSNMTKVVDVARWWNNSGFETATQAFMATTSTIGFALVTQFTY